MNSQQQKIWKFIQDNHVLSLTAISEESAWSANLFYATGDNFNELWLMTKVATRHGRLLVKNPKVSGTISNQESRIEHLKGIQYAGTLRQIEDSQLHKKALKAYIHQFPIARLHQETLWELKMEEIKFTNNQLGFGTKYNWTNKD